MVDQPRTAPDSSSRPAGEGDPAGSPRLEDLPLTLIRSGVGWQPIDLAELWRYRELLYFFTWRDIKVRYKQTELGAALAIIQPLLTTGVFVVLFGLLMGEGGEPTVPGVPYALCTFCAMLPWQLFAESLVRSSESLIEGQNLITKVFFPRILLPLSAVLTGLADFAIGLVVLVVMIGCYHFSGTWPFVPSWALLTLPLFVLLAVVASLAVSLWLSALSAIYRDFRYAQPFLVRLGFFVSPVVYAAARLEGKLSDWALAVYSLNPMVGVIEGFRWALFREAGPLEMMILAPSILMTAVLLVSGVRFFRQMEGTIVDVI